MKRIIEVQQPDNEPLHLTWVINNICTNSCSYCPSNLHAGKNHHYDWNNAKKFLDILFQRHKKIHCTISGGEPSVSPFFPELVKLFYDNGHSVCCTSNAAKPVKYWSNISQYLTYICFSYHPEFVDGNFVEKVLAASINTHVTVRVMMLPSRWDQCLEMYNRLVNEEKIYIEVVRIFNWDGSDQTAHMYTAEQEDFFKNYVPPPREIKHPRNDPLPLNPSTFIFDDGSMHDGNNVLDLINSGMTNFKGFTCDIGLKSLFVHFNGTINRGNCSVGMNIGNINEPDKINWPSGPVKCHINLCHCSSDVNISKVIDHV
jgi:organic radical activating enzyme